MAKAVCASMYAKQGVSNAATLAGNFAQFASGVQTLAP